jgi:hypothetical protein
METEMREYENEGGEACVNESEWECAHATLVRLSRERARLDSDEGRWLFRAYRSGAHLRLGYASFAEYIERLFGYSPRWTAEKLRVAEALEELPILSRALANGEISWSSARELTRVAVVETEPEWIEIARGRTAREVEKLVSGHRPGARPNDPPDPRAVRHVFRFEVSADTFATFREALAKLRRNAADPLDDDEALLLMARHILGGPTDAGRSSYQVTLDVCGRCRRGHMQACGDVVEIEPQVVETAQCDAHMTAVATSESLTHVGTARATQTIPPSVRRFVHHRDHGRCRVPGCRNATFVDIHHIDRKADGGSHDPENLVTLCSAHHRAIHRGTLRVDGRASTGLAFRHPDGSPYGSTTASPRLSDAFAIAFRALCSLGFREAESRRALERVRTHVGQETSAEAILRLALAELTQLTLSVRPNAFGPKAA